MSESLGSLSRTHTCGALRLTDVGADELANGTVTIKNMKTGEQKSVPRTETVKWLSN